MNKIASTIQRIGRRRHLRTELRVWGESRSLPFTEGQAVVARGSVGPAHPPFTVVQ